MIQRICIAGAALAFIAALITAVEGDRRAMELCQRAGYSFDTCHHAIYR